MHYYRKPSISTASVWIAGTLLALSQSAFASSFMLHEQNASGLGEFYAGAGSIAEDASTNYYNPAGLVLLPGTQFSASGVNVMSSFTFDGTTTYRSIFNSAPYTATGSASGGTSRLVPALHASHQFNDQWAVGLSFTAPFGLATSYDVDSIVRYQAVDSDLQTLNIGPSVAYRPVRWLSLGAGFDAQYAKLQISSAVNYDLGTVPDTATDGLSKNTADSWGWGWHAGALAIIDPQSRVGLNFRSSIAQDFTGNSVFDTATENHAAESDVSGSAEFPWLIDLSGVHAFNEKWTVLGSVSYIHWSSLTELKLENVSAIVPYPVPPYPPVAVTGTSVDTLNYKDTWSAFAGIRYQVNPVLLLKAGGGFDETPTQDAYRDLLVPDSDHWIASVGLRLTPPQAKNVSLDIAYARIFADNAKIEKSLDSDTTITNTAEGNVTGHADLIGAQLTLRII